jgi:hypothetical protein
MFRQSLIALACTLATATFLVSAGTAEPHIGASGNSGDPNASALAAKADHDWSNRPYYQSGYVPNYAPAPPVAAVPSEDCLELSSIGPC